MLPSDSALSTRPHKRARGTQPHTDPDSPPTNAPSTSQMVEDQPMSGAQPVNTTSSTTSRRTDDRSRKLSCKECRRLKLKCDRVFPCQSCVKRGCGSLCPEGALTAGRGSRFILANTEQLHNKISELGERVRQLEEGLEQLQASVSTQPHPLLAPDLLRIKTSQELYGTTPLPPLPSSLPQESPARQSQQQKEERLRESVVALSLDSSTNIHLSSSNTPGGVESSASSALLQRGSSPIVVAPDILDLSTAFPFPWSLDASIRKRIREALPPREEALVICEEARKNALWQYNLDTAETFIPNLLHYCYNTPVESMSSRRLALLLMVLSIGSLVDLSRPLGSVNGEAYHHLARASVCEIPLMEEPDFDELHALFFMMYYHLIFSDNKKAVGYAWNLMGFVAKLAQGLGLHRDAKGSKLIPEEHERRRAIFWELLNMDCRMSLSLGRPPSLSLAHVDIKTPSYEGAGIFVPKNDIVYHHWKNEFLVSCLYPILDAMTVAVTPGYERILELDSSVRDFKVPALLDEQYVNVHDATPTSLVMQRGLVTIGRDIALLQLHRRYFMQTMNSSSPFDMHHEFAPSVLATYLSASNLISAVKTLFDKEQELSVRFLHFWFNTFSAAVMLSLFISRAPNSPLAIHALQDLEAVCQLFRRAAVTLPFGAKVLPKLIKLAERSRGTIQQHAPASQLITGNPYPVTLPESFSKAHHSLSEKADRMRLTAPVIRNRPTIPSTLSLSFHSTASCIPVPFGSNFNTITNNNNGGNTAATMSTGDLLPETLPDIYHFSTMGAALESRYGFVAATEPQILAKEQMKTPFIPSSPRISEDERFNFDFGALNDELEDTSYMAWF